MNLQVMYNIRGQIPNLLQRVEAAVMVASEDIMNEAEATPDHANRLAWAGWANSNSGVATLYFMWPLAMNPSVQSSVADTPDGSTVPDTDIQYVVNAALPRVLEQCKKEPPAGFTPV
jgi:hypothetical protein